jgi:CubicO group peptidase (beta-lactamase class C family)
MFHAASESGTKAGLSQAGSSHSPNKAGAALRFMPQNHGMKELIWVMMICGMTTLCCAAEITASALPRGTPEAEGIPSAAILDFVQTADRDIDALHSFMLVRHGHVVAEGWWSPYGPEIRHSMFSLSKSFTSTAVGLAIAEGKLNLDDEVLKFFPGDAPPQPSANLKAMRVRDLLMMSSGQHAEDVASFSFDSSERLTKQFLALPVAHKPGTHFVYNTPGTYMLSAIVQQVTGKTVLDYLRPRLFDPLGIEQPEWETSAQGVALGGYGLSIRTEDIAKFGQLYLQHGNWRGKELVPAAWVAAATSRQTSNGSNPDNDWEQGYGYQFWRCRHGLFRGDGAFGQFCIVMPEQDAVLAITSGTKDMGAVLNLVWDKLLPAMQPKSSHADAEALATLKQTLAGLKLRTQAGTGAPGATAKAAAGRRFLFPKNSLNVEAAALEFNSPSGPTLLLRCGGNDYRIACRNGEWAKDRLAFGALPEGPVAVSGAWTSDSAYTATIWYYETPFRLTATLRFAGDQLLLDSEFNVSLRGPTKQPTLTGRQP